MASFIKIKVLAFGVARDITGAGSVELQFPEGTTLAQVQRHFQEKYPAFNRLSNLLLAINAEYAAPDTMLRENDEVALIPPVSGG